MSTFEQKHKFGERRFGSVNWVGFYTLYYKGEILLAVLKLLKLFYYLIFLSTLKEILNFLGGYDLFHK